MMGAFAKSMHLRMRQEKLQLFFAFAGDTHKDTLLDVGGAAGFEGEFIVLHQRFRSTYSVNLTPSWLNGAGGSAVIADACCLPFADGSFDWVFSNAVIEHVGSWEKQKQFAAEINRVARKGYFIGTPNRNFPVDPHTYVPLFQFLPPDWQRSLCRFTPGPMRGDPQSVELLTSKRLSILFPEASILKVGLPVLRNNLIAVFRKQ